MINTKKINFKVTVSSEEEFTQAKKTVLLFYPFEEQEAIKEVKVDGNHCTIILYMRNARFVLPSAPSGFSASFDKNGYSLYRNKDSKFTLFETIHFEMETFIETVTNAGLIFESIELFPKRQKKD